MNIAFARTTLAASLLGITLALAPSVFAQSGPLDGKVFLGDAGPKGKEADEKGDVLTFAGGTFHSSSCDQYGYSTSAYKATANGDAINFEVETQSEKDGRLVWKGTVRGSEVEGTFVHYRKGWLLNPNPEPQEHWFKGKAKT
jgi:hypothetical protein